jgi:hypothetical protein
VTIRGCDVSHHQDYAIDFAGQVFVGVRTTFGTEPDDWYVRHATAARKAGVLLIAYHFGRSTTFGSIGMQMTAFRHAAAAVPPDGWALDLERDVPPEGSPPRPSMTTAEAALFIAMWHKGEPDPILLYRSAGSYPNLGQDGRWVADYRRASRAAGHPPIPYDIWQYASVLVDGHRIDGDRSELSRADLAALLAGHTSGPSVPPGDTVTIVTQQPYPARAFTSKAGLKQLRRFTATAELAPITVPYSADVDADVGIDGTGPHGVLGSFLRLAPPSGSAGDYVLAAEVDVTMPPPPADTTPFSQADVDNARAAGAEAQSQADIAAVTAAQPK